ncbi:MAG: hypothetical protein ACJ0BH_05485 [Candidatus Puniceispirillaceae bacterium]
MELILTLGPTLLVYVGAGEFHANDPGKAQVQYTADLKLKKDIRAKTLQPTMQRPTPSLPSPHVKDMKEHCFILGLHVTMTGLYKRI